jgi:hypothetical protein
MTQPTVAYRQTLIDSESTSCLRTGSIAWRKSGVKRWRRSPSAHQTISKSAFSETGLASAARGSFANPSLAGTIGFCFAPSSPSATRVSWHTRLWPSSQTVLRPRRPRHPPSCPCCRSWRLDFSRSGSPPSEHPSRITFMRSFRPSSGIAFSAKPQPCSARFVKRGHKVSSHYHASLPTPWSPSSWSKRWRTAIPTAEPSPPSRTAWGWSGPSSCSNLVSKSSRRSCFKSGRR